MFKITNIETMINASETKESFNQFFSLPFKNPDGTYFNDSVETYCNKAIQFLLRGRLNNRNVDIEFNPDLFKQNYKDSLKYFPSMVKVWKNIITNRLNISSGIYNLTADGLTAPIFIFRSGKLHYWSLNLNLVSNHFVKYCVRSNFKERLIDNTPFLEDIYAFYAI